MTPQYAGLQRLHEKYADRGFAVIGFPCNQFGKQEPGSIEEITTFAKEEYGVAFEIYNKIDVNGEQASPLFEFLKKECPGIFGTEGVKWNFTKFLCDEAGTPWKRYGPTVKPEGAVLTDIELLLKHREIGKKACEQKSALVLAGKEKNRIISAASSLQHLFSHLAENKHRPASTAFMSGRSKTRSTKVPKQSLGSTKSPAAKQQFRRQSARTRENKENRTASESNQPGAHSRREQRIRAEEEAELTAQKSSAEGSGTQEEEEEKQYDQWQDVLIPVLQANGGSLAWDELIPSIQAWLRTQAHFDGPVAWKRSQSKNRRRGGALSMLKVILGYRSATNDFTLQNIGRLSQQAAIQHVDGQQFDVFQSEQTISYNSSYKSLPINEINNRNSFEAGQDNIKHNGRFGIVLSRKSLSTQLQEHGLYSGWHDKFLLVEVLVARLRFPAAGYVQQDGSYQVGSGLNMETEGKEFAVPEVGENLLAALAKVQKSLGKGYVQAQLNSTFPAGHSNCMLIERLTEEAYASIVSTDADGDSTMDEGGSGPEASEFGRLKVYFIKHKCQALIPKLAPSESEWLELAGDEKKARVRQVVKFEAMWVVVVRLLKQRHTRWAGRWEEIAAAAAGPGAQGGAGAEGE